MLYEFMNFLAFDFGATSGRAVLGVYNSGLLETTELARFENSIVEKRGKFYWNFFHIVDFVKECLKICVSRNIIIESIGIDTWGVDFVCFDEEGNILDNPRAYRDPYSNGQADRFFEKTDKRDVYDITGIQTMDINTIFQMCAMAEEENSIAPKTKYVLFMPDAIMYMLTGKMVCEYTIASTSQMLNVRTKKIELSLLKKTGFHLNVFDYAPDCTFSGVNVGTVKKEICDEIGLDTTVKVVAVAGHDTASAVSFLPASDEKTAFMSSGTWSLLGVEMEQPVLTDNAFSGDFTNEGGIDGTITFLKNITGMWILEQCRKEWKSSGKDYSYPEIIALAETSHSDFLFNPDDNTFANPRSMITALREFATRTGQLFPENDGCLMRAIFNSMAHRYAEVIKQLEDVCSFHIDSLFVVGGGGKNALLNQLTSDAANKKVVAGVSEASSLGNLLIQMRTAGIIRDRKEMWAFVDKNMEIKEFFPSDT
ncbi:MAG: rhamnulokinase [Bacteroidales bacterium]|nr:rhamnulokinase [Bacteroidales bacterium]